MQTGEPLEIRPLDTPPNAVAVVPGSKSYTNRALVTAALAEGTSVLRGALFSDDTLHMADCLEGIGIGVSRDEDRSQFEVSGCAGVIPRSGVELYAGNAGTVARFLPPLLAVGEGEFLLDGAPRMRERPLGSLVAALEELGADIVCVNADGALPIRVDAHGLEGGAISLPGDTSSQFTSGLLLSAPYMRRGLDLAVTSTLVSRPYLDMTVDTMRRFGVAVGRPDSGRFVVPPGRYRGIEYEVEPDASAASYFFAAAALTGGRVEVPGLGGGSLQGDLRFVEILERMGATVKRRPGSIVVSGPPEGELDGVDVDMRDMSDVAQTLAVVAPFARTPTRIRGIGFVRGKETDRISATVTELRRLGIDADVEPEGMVIRPSEPHAGTVDTYDDHRMAMSFALIGLVVPGIRIADPGCCAKTFPLFFDELARLSESTPKTLD